MTHLAKVSLRSLGVGLLLSLVVAAPGSAQQPSGCSRPIRDYEACVYLLVASNDTTHGGSLPPSLASLQKPVLSMVQLQSLRLATTFVYRVRSHGNVQASGVTGPLLPIATSPSTPAFYSLAIRSIEESVMEGSRPAVDIDRFDFNLRIPIVAGRTSAEAGSDIQYENVGASTELRAPVGEPVVAGTITSGRPDELFVIVLLVKPLT